MNREQKIAVGLVVFDIIYMIGAWRLPRFALGASVIDAHVFPLLLGGTLLVLSAIYYVQSARRPDAKPLLDGVDKPLLLKLVGTTAIYALVLGTLGYLIATSVFLVGVMYILGRRSWRGLVGISLGFSAFTYFMFAYVLSVPLAKGILPF